MATFTRICFYCRREFEATHALANLCPSHLIPTAVRKALPPAPPEPAVVVRVVEVEESDNRPNPEPEPGPATGPTGDDVACRKCGKAIEPGPQARKYCSRTCRRARQRKLRREMIRRAFVEPVSMAVLRERDAGTCRICGEPVDFTRQPPHPESATIDHVVALARGGAHSYDNTQLAHHRCNTEKGSDPPRVGPGPAARDAAPAYAAGNIDAASHVASSGH